MPKKKFFSSIFSRLSKPQTADELKNDQLVTDAVPTPDENSNDSLGDRVEEINNSTPLPSFESSVAQLNDNTPLPSGILSSFNSQQLVPSPQRSVASSPQLGPMSMPHNNNMLAVHNSQAQNVFHVSNSSNVQIGSVFQIRIGDPEPERASSKNPPKEPRAQAYTRTVQEMQQSTEPLNEKHLSEISKHLGEGWQDVMRQLKFSEGQIHQFMVDFHVDGGLREVIYQLLLDWWRNEKNATVGEITSILWSSGHHETVSYLKKMYKADRKASHDSKAEKMSCE